MAKNMTRKGLAVGAAFALVATGFVSAPAQAAAGIELAAKDGKSVYGMLSGETFTFTANGNVDFNVNNAGLLRVEIVNTTGGGSPTGFAINGTTLDGDRTNDNDGNVNNTSNTIELANGDETAVTLGATAGNKAVMGLGAVANEAAATAGASAMTSPFTYSFSATAAASTPQAYAVTVFADANNNGVKDSGELASATQTVTFYNVADVTVNYTIDEPIEGAAKVGSDVTISGIALDQLTAAEFGVQYSTGTDAALGTGDKLDIVAFDTNKTKFESDLALTAHTLAKDTAVKAQLKYLNNTGPNVNGSNGAAVGTFATRVVTAAKVADVTASTVVSTSANASNFKPDSTYQVKALVEDATTGTAAADPVANVAVTAKVEVFANDGTTAKTLSSTVYVEINGTRYTDATKLPGATGIAQLSLTTDAKGEVLVTVATKGLDGTGANATATDSVKITFTSELISDAGSTSTLEAQDAAFTARVTNHDATSANTVDGQGVQFVVEAWDQYGGRPADEYDARAVFGSSNQGAAADKNSTSATSVVQAMVGGRAVFTVTDNGTGTGANVYALSVDKRANGGGYVGSSNILAAAETDNGNFTINLVANATAGAITVTGYTKQTSGTDSGKFTKATAEKQLALTTFGAWNANAVLGTEPTGLVEADEAHVIAGTVTTAGTATVAAAALVGVPVTVSGAGLQFVYTASGTKKIYGVGSISFVTGASGAWSVAVYSNKAGKQTITVTAGSVTETVIIDDYAEADDNTGASLVINAPANVLPGSTVTITAVLTDKYGNPVNTVSTTATSNDEATELLGDFKISYSGPGLQVGSTPTETDASGEAKLGYFLGANDSGTITITASYDADGDANYNETGDLVVAKTITIGAASAVTGTTSVKRTGNTVAVRVTGANARIVLNGVRVASRSTAGVLTRTLTLRAGRNVIQLVVGGEVIRTVRYTR